MRQSSVAVAVAVSMALAAPAWANKADTFKVEFQQNDGVYGMRGLFGENWQPGEVQQEVAKNCAEIGRPLASFKVLGRNARGLRVFEAVCK